MTLDQQIAGLEAITTASAEQFKAKNSILSTLRSLRILRTQFEGKRPDETKIVSLLVQILDGPTNSPKPTPPAMPIPPSPIPPRPE